MTITKSKGKSMTITNSEPTTSTCPTPMASENQRTFVSRTSRQTGLGSRRPARRCLNAFLGAAAGLGLLIASPMAANASTSTALLGNTSIPRIPRDGTPGDSNCAAGSSAVGARIWYDTFPRISGVATWCRDSGGSVSLGATVGDTSKPFEDSLCNGADVAVGLFGANGEVVNALGVRCAGAGGTYDAARVGNTNTVTSTADCPEGTVLDGLTAWYGAYSSFTNVYGVQGSCHLRYTFSEVLQPIKIGRASCRERV